MFRPEILLDQVTDIWVGLLGGFVAFWLRTRLADQGHIRARFKTSPAAPVVRDLAVAVSVSTVWVAFYGYRYNVEPLNSGGINWWAFSWWSGGLFAMLRLFDWLRGVISPRWLAVPATWAAWVAVLLAVEYVGYAIVGIREVRGGGPLIFDVIHGTPTMKLYYAVASLLTVGIAAGLKKLAARMSPTPGASTD